MSLNQKLYILKGLIYCIFFNIIGLTILLELNYYNMSYSIVVNTIAKTYPVQILAFGFIISGFSALIYSVKNICWNILIFLPMFIYTFSTMVVFLFGKVPFIIVPFYLLISVLNIYDVFEKRVNKK